MNELELLKQVYDKLETIHYDLLGLLLLIAMITGGVFVQLVIPKK